MRLPIRPLILLSAILTMHPMTTGAAEAPRTPSADAATGAIMLKDVPAVKQLQRDLASEGERRIREAREQARVSKARKHGRRGDRVRPVPSREEGLVNEAPVRRLPPELRSYAPAGTNAVPSNVRFNDPTTDGLNSAQSEVSIAIVGSLGLAAWNDGQGFITPPGGMAAGYTTNGGATWHDVGLPPLTGTITDWISDPVVAANEKTGEFWFCGLTQNGASNNGVAVVRATFPGGVFTWDTPHIVRDLPATTDFLDKEWMVADSTTGNLYLTYTHFVVSGGDISFQRSLDGGANWDPELQVSNHSGSVQGSRPVVAGDGSVYVTWKEFGPVDADFVNIRRSTDHGVSFGVQNTAVSFFDNFGSGAPGFNRNRNVVEPCAAVDRSTGPHRGRIYAVAHESLNFYDDFIGGGGNKNEVENNNFFARATPFTPGQKLRGGLTTITTDFDYFSFTATAGTSYIFYCDSIPRPLYTMRVFCGLDTTTRLSFSGDVDAPSGGQSLLVWTAPNSGTFYLRMAYVAGGTGAGNYRIQTGVANHGAEPGRDQRDIIVHYSDDGGSTWSAPARVNDSAALYDEFLPEVGVTAEGYPYCAWYDYRDAAGSCAGRSHIYASRSTDGGTTWAANQLVTTAQTAWTTANTNIQPNMGDYVGLYAGGTLALGWGDARAGEADVNVWGTNVPVDAAVGCPRDTFAVSNSTVVVNLPVTNHNTLYPNTYDIAVSINRAWGVSNSSSITVAENNGTGNVPVSITVPDTANGRARVCVTVSQAGAGVHTCCFTIRASSPLAVPGPGVASFAIQAVSPNPATRALSVEFSLPGWSPGRLELIDVNGRRVAGREVGSLGAGRHVVRFDHELAGLPAGMYEVRLIQGARSLTRKVSIVH